MRKFLSIVIVIDAIDWQFSGKALIKPAKSSYILMEIYLQQYYDELNYISIAGRLS